MTRALLLRRLVGRSTSSKAHRVTPTMGKKLACLYTPLQRLAPWARHHTRTLPSADIHPPPATLAPARRPATAVTTGKVRSHGKSLTRLKRRVFWNLREHDAVTLVAAISSLLSSVSSSFSLYSRWFYCAWVNPTNPPSLWRWSTLSHLWTESFFVHQLSWHLGLNRLSSKQSIRFQQFSIQAGIDSTGVATDMVSVNTIVKFKFRNTATFFGLHVTATPLHLSFSKLNVATGVVSPHPTLPYTKIPFSCDWILIPFLCRCRSFINLKTVIKRSKWQWGEATFLYTGEEAV